MEIAFQGGYWLEITGNFSLWFLHLLFIAEILFCLEVKFLPQYVVIIIVFGTLKFQAMFPESPIYHINVLPAALVYMTRILYIKNLERENM